MLEEHLGYVSDSLRLKQFTAAFRQLIQAGDRCADLGSGTGVLALLALRAGAGHVHCIEGSGIIEIAREMFFRAGLADHVSFHRSRSQQILLPHRMDVLVCDHVGYFGFDYGIISLLRDARSRFLRAGGTVVPRAIRLEVAAADSERCLKLGRGWSGDSVPTEFHWLTEYSVNTKHALEAEPEELCSDAAELGRIDLEASCPDFMSWQATVRVKRSGHVNGLCGWFHCELAPGIWMTNSPLAGERIDRPQVFLPFREPVHVRAGEALSITVMARADSDIIAWTVQSPDGRDYQAHSTWNGKIQSAADLARTLPDHVPRLTREAAAREIVLGYCDGRRTLGEIERLLLRDHSDLFPSRSEISRFITSVLGKDTK